MYGCPYGLIYNTSSTLEELKGKPNFSYIGGVIAERFSERNAEVRIECLERSSGSRLIFAGARVFVGAGVIPTTRLMLESMGAYDREVVLKDSQYFLLPWLRYSGAETDLIAEPLHTLSQVFIEVFNREVSERSIHLQVYSYNDLFKSAIGAALGPLRSLFPSQSFLKRFLLIQGYLHSDVSSSIRISLSAPAGNSRAKMALIADINPVAARTIKRLTSVLRQARSLFRAVPIPFMTKIGQPGRGFHSGGTFPMRERPREFETDRLGRPSGFRKVHLIDATTFPSIPASTITLTAMANAHRIGTEAVQAA
jgi:hypothetical protein